jgi:hypothetical protein
MVLEEYNPELVYLPGRLNIVADALSRLDFDDGIEDAQLNELLAFDESELPLTSYPLLSNIISVTLLHPLRYSLTLFL